MFQELFYLHVDAMPAPELMCKAPEEGVGGPTGRRKYWGTCPAVSVPLLFGGWVILCTSPSRWMRVEFVPLLSGVHPCNAMTNAVVQASDTGG